MELIKTEKLNNGQILYFQDTEKVVALQMTQSYSLFEGATLEEVEKTLHPEKKAPSLDMHSKYISSVPGTAKLIRNRDKIWIAYRRGKDTLNQNTFNCVCIDDAMKRQFFNDVKARYGSDASSFSFSDKDDPVWYDHWDKIMTSIFYAGK